MGLPEFPKINYIGIFSLLLNFKIFIAPRCWNR
jgi:hypothetical protein